MLTLLPLLAGLTTAGAAAADCAQHANTLSCSPDARGADACCVPSAGLFVFRQRFDPNSGDFGAWGIEGLDVLE